MKKSWGLWQGLFLGPVLVGSSIMFGQSMVAGECK